MVTITIKNGIHVKGLPSNIEMSIRSNLTFPNPAYKNAKRFGAWVPPNITQDLKFYSVRDDNMFLPKGYIHFLLSALKNNKIEYKINDFTTKTDPIDFQFNGTPRDYQKESIDKMMGYPNGVLESDTGSGKTFMALYMISRRKQKTLVLVHTKELFYQWQQAIGKLFTGNVKVGMYGDGKKTIGDITIGLVKTIQNNIQELKDKFGFVIVDECHRTPSSTFVDVLSQFSCKYCLGLSATSYRNDGLTGAIYYFIGPKMHSVDKNKLISSGAVLKPRIERIKTDYYFFYNGNYSTMMTNLSKNIQRNRLIVDAIRKDLREFNNAVIIVSDRVEHCYTLQEMLSDVNSVVLTAKTAAAERKQIVNDVKSGKEKVVFSTVQLIGEGFDAPNLHALFLATPIKYRGRLMQVVGRVLRPEEGKIARVYDFVDHKVEPLYNAWKEREKSYRVQWGKGI